MESDSKAGNSQHGQVVGTVAHSNSLRNIHFLHLSYQTQQLCLTLTVDYITEIAAGQFAILYFQLVGIHIVYTVLLLEVLPEVGKPSRKNSYLVTVFLQNIHQAIHTFRNGKILCNLLHHGLIQSFQQSHSFAKALDEIYLTTHGTFGNGLHLVAHTCTYGQFINHFRFNQRRVHIEANEAAHPAVHIVQLEREIHFQFGCQFHQLFLHGNTVFRSATNGKFDAGACTRFAFVQRDTSCKALDGIDIHALLCKNTGNGRYLTGRQLTPQ